MAENTLGIALRNAALGHPSVTALVDGETRLTYAELDSAATRLAKGLTILGVGHGDHVGLWMQTRAEWIICFCACARIGAVVVPINTRYKAEEAQYLIAQADVKVLIAERQVWKNDAYALMLSMCPELPAQPSGALHLSTFPQLRSIVIVDGQAPAGTVAYRSVLEAAPDDMQIAPETPVKESDPLLICFTSGSTGRPKGVVHSHRTLRHARRIADLLRINPGDALLANWPLYHVAGLFIVTVPAILSAATMVLQSHWSGDVALDLIERERISVIGGVATHYFDMVSAMNDRPRDTSSVKVAYIGGSTLREEIFDNIMQTLRIERLLSTYGMTENTVSTTFNAWDDPKAMCCRNMAQVITEGRVRIVDPDSLEELPAGSQGEIWCSGPTVMLHYYKLPDATARALTEDGWLRTGDLGRFDENGYLEITGRIKDIIKVGGTNVSPVEIENILMGMQAVSFAVAVGVPDTRLGEVVYAYVEAKPDATLDASELVSWCRPVMAEYKIPRHIKVIESFPRLATGKIDRSLLARMAIQEVLAKGGR
ncbi:class I adenylate-forming enzyme family protein [Paraburkholderia sp. IW21]|jgi:fatty-acyl-CoA synthase|uniref:class I adenylate-forming enzyme family protein n=1 Tax=Paraburkholderia sp. IW21 TaxID=3242488 RepID=UPI003522DC5B